MSLDLEYRPDTFEGIIGNNELITSIKKKLGKKGHKRSIMFFGGTGCGKTTTARVSSAFVGALPINVKEINCSSNNGVDTAREIIKTMDYRPMGGGKKVYILDEFHKATPQMQEALLKPFEEPPDHVYFMICTTNPEKLLPAILSRFTVQYELEPPTRAEIVKHLLFIKEEENLDVSRAVISKICKTNDSHPRACVLSLEMVAEIEGEEAQIKAIKKVDIEDATTKELCQALLKGESWRSISKVLKTFKGNPEQARKAVLGYMTRVLLDTDSIKAALVIEYFADNFFDSGRAGLVLACYNIFSD